MTQTNVGIMRRHCVLLWEGGSKKACDETVLLPLCSQFIIVSRTPTLLIKLITTQDLACGAE